MTGTQKVGAVADSSGLTVRTLHHWDEIGLLSPSRRSFSGHREYDAGDLARLYLILVLRDLGLSLESIRTCLDGGVDPRRVLTDHLAQIEQAQQALARLGAKVSQTLEAADQKSHDSSLDLLELLRDARPAAAEVLDRYLDPDQQAALASGAAAVGPALPYLVEVEMPQLYRQAEELRRKGTKPDDPRVQRIVARLDELSSALGGNQAGSGAKVRQAWRDHPAAMSGEPEPVAAGWRDVADFVEAARAIRAG
jgi:DNA-binding transcriptional MerR regulator